MPIIYTSGDASQPASGGYRLIAHIANDRGGWGRGFVGALSRRYPIAEARYRAWFRGQDPLTRVPFSHGCIQAVKVGNDLSVVNMLAQRGYQTSLNPVPLDYDALSLCLRWLGRYALDEQASVHMPRIGTGLAGGDWSRIEPLLEQHLVAVKVPVTIYIPQTQR